MTTVAVEIYNQNANSLADVNISDGSSNAIRTWVVQIKDASTQTPFTFTWSETGLSGSVTRKIRFGRGFGNTGNVVTFSSQQLTVQDIGPA